MRFVPISCIIVLAFFSFTLNATTIIPCGNLGQLAESSDDIIIARVVAANIPHGEEYKNYSWELSVQQSFLEKFNPNDILHLSAQSGQSATFRTAISGDIRLDVGETYLIFLDQNVDGIWMPRTLSYYLYRQESAFGNNYFVPVKEGLDIHIAGEEDSFFVIDADQFTAYLETHIKEGFSKEWADSQIKANKNTSNFYADLRAAPGHCVFSMDMGGTPFRWDIFPTNPLNIYCDTEVDTDFVTSHTEVTNAITNMSGPDLNDSYTGLNLFDSGVVGTNFTPSCSGGTVQGSDNFLTYSNTLNGGDNILVVFNDPCNQISNALTCAGGRTLAIGGLYGYTPTHMFDGISWNTGGNGFVVINNDTKSCVTVDEYKTMLIHEMTHCLGLGHITGTGTANMNPECCNDITLLDQGCVNYLYSAVLPVELVSFKGHGSEKGNELFWSTASELNSKSFEIERSTDGRKFEFVATIPAKGNSSEIVEYNYIDKTFAKSALYYRLKQIDFDGQYEYSEIVVIDATKQSDIFTIYPNPAEELLQLSAPSEEKSTIRIFNTTGKIFYSEVGTAIDQIDISEFPQGVYYISFENVATSQVLSFVKVKP